MTKTFRKTITLPTYLQSYVENCDNFSGVVSQLVDENAPRIEDGNVLRTHKERKQLAKQIIYEHTNRLAKDITEKVIVQETEMLGHYINELRLDRKRLELLATRLRSLENTINEIKLTKEKEIRQIVYSSIKDSTKLLFEEGLTEYDIDSIQI